MSNRSLPRDSGYKNARVGKPMEDDNMYGIKANVKRPFTYSHGFDESLFYGRPPAGMGGVKMMSRCDREQMEYPNNTPITFAGNPVDNNLNGLKVNVGDITLQIAPNGNGGLTVTGIEKGDLVIKGQSAIKILEKGIEETFPKI